MPAFNLLFELLLARRDTSIILYVSIILTFEENRMPRTITFQPSLELGSFIEELLKSGMFNNQSEIIRAGLRLLQEQTAESKLQKLRDLIDEAENSPILDNWDINKFLARTMEKK